MDDEQEAAYLKSLPKYMAVRQDIPQPVREIEHDDTNRTTIKGLSHVIGGNPFPFP
ncbi:MAG: hypothetical protein IJ144_05525 [Prevotella sp.]|nr:hypothetical protein [Prevotella sp.]